MLLGIIHHRASINSYFIHQMAVCHLHTSDTTTILVVVGIQLCLVQLLTKSFLLRVAKQHNYGFPRHLSMMLKMKGPYCMHGYDTKGAKNGTFPLGKLANRKIILK